MNIILGLLTVANLIKAAKLPLDLIKEVFSLITWAFNGVALVIKWCWAEVPQSFKDKINNFELLKVLVLAGVAYITSGGGVTGILKVLEVFSVHVGDVYTDASNVAMITGVVAMVAGYIKHKYFSGAEKAQA